jgi:hypothetical protein
MVPYLESTHWMVWAIVGLCSCRLHVIVVSLVAAFTRSDKRHRQCIEVLWAARRTARSVAPIAGAAERLPSGDRRASPSESRDGSGEVDLGTSSRGAVWRVLRAGIGRRLPGRVRRADR